MDETRRLKILHVIPSLALAHGGPSRAIRLIEQALREQGLDVETATTDDDGTGGRNGKPGGVLLAEEGAARLYFRKTSNPYKTSAAFARWIFRHARDYDLIHIHALFSFTSTMAAWAARRARVPYVIRPLGTLSGYGLAKRRPWLKRCSLALIEGAMLRHAAAVHFTSEMEREEAVSLGIPMRSVINPLAVELPPDADPELLFSDFPELRGRPWVVFLSRMDQKKNVEGLLEAIALCAAELPGIRWLLAGNGEKSYVDGLHALAKRLGINDRIIWAGHIQGERKSAALAHALLYVLPSYSENFGIAAAEALQAGLPVVLGRGVALAELVARDGAGIVVEPVPDAIAEALRAYLLDPAARSRASANARSLAAREFSPEMMGARLMGLYQTILSTPDRKWPCAPGND